LGKTMANAFQLVTTQSVLVEGISGPGGADRMYITAGVLQTWGPGAFAGLIDPILEPGQFRRAIASASLMSTGKEYGVVYTLSEVDADWDDESGKVELRFSLDGEAIQIAFQLITFASSPSL
jgi:hypothetical protein